MILKHFSYFVFKSNWNLLRLFAQKAVHIYNRINRNQVVFILPYTIFYMFIYGLVYRVEYQCIPIIIIWGNVVFVYIVQWSYQRKYSLSFIYLFLFAVSSCVMRSRLTDYYFSFLLSKIFHFSPHFVMLLKNLRSIYFLLKWLSRIDTHVWFQFNGFCQKL